jgi:ClpP class serine protease
MRLLGFSLMRYIDINDSEQVMRAIQLTDPKVPLDLVLHTPGGLVLASLQIARALKLRQAKTTVFVPHLAMSGGTLMALAADEIVMSLHAVLGPVDPRVNGLLTASIIRGTEQKPIAGIDDQTSILADIGGKRSSRSRARSARCCKSTCPRSEPTRSPRSWLMGYGPMTTQLRRPTRRRLGLPSAPTCRVRCSS